MNCKKANSRNCILYFLLSFFLCLIQAGLVGPKLLAQQEENEIIIIQNSPLVGAIRWDGWVGKKGTWQIGPIVERTLGPEKFHYRAPFFSIVTAKDSISIDGTSQEIMDKEIAYAKDAGIDYWAYCWYPDGCGLELARKLHQSSDYANDVKWCVVLGAFEENVSNNYGKVLVSDFTRENYMKVLNGRPLVYLYSSDLTRAGLDKLRSMAISNHLKDPYVVVMNWGAASATDYCELIGADAISSYAALGKNNLPFADVIPSQSLTNWESYAAKKPVVPWICTGWNAKPRMESVNPWSEYYSDATNCQDATVNDIKDFLQTGIDWTNANKSKAEANTIIMYAWNEHDEGYGAICPTLGTDGNPETERLDAVKEVLQSRVQDTIIIKTFNVSVNIKDSWTNLPIPDIKVKINSIDILTDSNGIAHFLNAPDLFILSIEDQNYQRFTDQLISINSDTVLTFYLSWKGYTVAFTLQDEETSEKFRGAVINLGTATQVTDTQGQAVFSVSAGIYEYSINKLDYLTETGNMTVDSDTSMIFNLKRISANAKFRLKDGTTPLNNAKIKLNEDSLLTNSLGIALFKELPLNSIYIYEIEKEGFVSLNGEFILKDDTIFDFILEKSTVGLNEKPNSEIINLWPNPINDYLNCSFPEQYINSTLIITDLSGKEVYHASVKDTGFAINMKNIPSGAYILRIISEQESKGILIIKK